MPVTHLVANSVSKASLFPAINSERLVANMPQKVLSVRSGEDSKPIKSLVVRNEIKKHV